MRPLQASRRPVSPPAARTPATDRLDHAFDHAIDALGIEQQVTQRVRDSCGQSLFHRRPGACATRRAHSWRSPRSGLDASGCARAIHCRSLFSAHSTIGGSTSSPRRPSRIAQRASRLASHRRFAQLQNVEARAVGDCIDDRFRRDRTRRQQQRELLDFLMRGQQIAFDALCEQRRGVRIGLQIVICRDARESTRADRARSIGQICITTPCFSIALTQRELCMRPSILPVMISTRLSGEGCSASSMMASAPCSPGVGLAMRISMILRSANSDMARLSASSPCQSKPRSTTCSSRSVNPAGAPRRESRPRLR